MESITRRALPRNAVDARGRAVPMTGEEIRARADEVARGLDALDQIGDEQEQGETLDLLMKALDEDRMSYRQRSS